MDVEQPDRGPSRYAGGVETGQQPRGLIRNHPFTLEGEPGAPEGWPEICGRCLGGSPSFCHSGAALCRSPVGNSKREPETGGGLEAVGGHAGGSSAGRGSRVDRQRLGWPDVGECELRRLSGRSAFVALVVC